MDVLRFMGDKKTNRRQKLAMIRDLNESQMRSISQIIENILKSHTPVKKTHRTFLRKPLKRLKELTSDLSIDKKRRILASLDEKVWRILVQYT